ncbi:M16 family metallopeptidase [Actinobacillus lignieresii]|uniref:Putative zinc protease n=1 Tax=Actinobacillus lignieresii TaxID=720 RepID=A0A380TZU6_ACTLI|nr:pitrilysin family protein [Actinobacillus lignieresii]SUT93551.1 putative zinc protease [Actinobacillus lignieresii]
MRIILTSLVLFVASTTSYAEKSEPIQGQLENGLRYTLLPLHSEKGRIEIRMKVNAGAIDETDTQLGATNVLKHLVLRGTNAHPNGLTPYLHEQKWKQEKNYHIETGYDHTTYHMIPPSTSNLDKSLYLLEQMLFQAKLTQEDLDDERKHILEEWRQAQSVGSLMNQKRIAAVRADSRYADRAIIGTAENIQNLPATQLQQFYQTWYTPNNMQLLVVGDIEPEAAQQQIQQRFSSFTAKEMPKRDYLEPKLSEGLAINKLQDARSSVSQVAYIFRFDEMKHRVRTNEARYERLIDRLALALLSQRLQDQSAALPKGVSAITVRKSDIGRNTAALGWFATVASTQHELGLKQIFSEIEHLKGSPITEEELTKQKEAVQIQIENAKKDENDRDFQQWLQIMSESVLADKPYLTQKKLAELLEPMLKKVSAKEVNERIQQWIGSKDRLINYQPPRKVQIKPITLETVNKLQAEAEQTELAKTEAEKTEVEKAEVEKTEATQPATEKNP